MIVYHALWDTISMKLILSLTSLTLGAWAVHLTAEWMHIAQQVVEQSTHPRP